MIKEPVAINDRFLLIEHFGKLFLRQAGQSGETEKLALETLDKSLSLDPDFSGTPFISYDVLKLGHIYIKLYWNYVVNKIRRNII